MTDSEGKFSVGPSLTPGLPASGGTWISPKQGVDEVAASGTLWAYRTIAVRGVVRTLDPGATIDMKSVRLVLIPASDGLDPGRSNRRDSPGTQEWLEAHGLARWPLVLGHPDADGRFSANVPQISGLALVADAQGWRTAISPVAMEGDAQDVELVLKRGIVLSGVVRAVDGTPVPGARVVAYVTIRGDYAEGSPGKTWSLQPEGGMSGVRDKRNGTSRTTLHKEARTDAEGRFRVAARVDGDVRVLVYGEGYRPIDSALGHLSDDVGDLQFEAERISESGLVRFRCGRKPLGELEIIVSDQSGAVEQPALSYQTDAEGSVRSDWFVVGKLYAIIAMGSKVPEEARGPRFLRWSGEREIDLASLPLQRP